MCSTGMALHVDPDNEMTKHQTATAMARASQECTANLRRQMDEIGKNCATLHEVFVGKDESGRSFDIGYDFRGERHFRSQDEIFKGMARTAWGCIAEKLGIRNVMSIKRREEFDKQLERGELPEISEETIIGVIQGLAGQVQDFASEAVREVFDYLRPMRGDYKTNDKFRVGRKVILSWAVERGWNGKTFHVNYNREKNLRAIDAVFHILDGAGVMREHRGPLITAINECAGSGETQYFRFRCYKNHNLHLEFKRLDLVKQLNGIATGEHVLGEDTGD